MVVAMDRHYSDVVTCQDKVYKGNGWQQEWQSIINQIGKVKADIKNQVWKKVE